MVLLHVLFEHAAGYALFAVREVEEISLLLPQVEESVLTIGKFHNVVKLVAFAPFKSAQSALENINAVSEGILHEDLRLLLETSMPAKKKKALLGVADAKIGAAILEELGYQCQTGGVVAEILRGIRLHFHALVKGLTAQSASKAQLGLGHSYSRAKVKFNVNRVDNMIIQSISLLDQLDKDINTFSMRVREWYGYHFPELIKIVSENYTYCRLAKFIGNRKELSEESLEGLEEIVMDSAKAQAILEASRSSMGMDISPIDLINIESFSSRVISLSEYRKGLQEYLRSKMSQVAPSLSALIGEVVGARLISHAGSLTNLAKYPASTVQILGAEKALFRALKTRGNTPKYGLIFHSTFIGRAAAKNKGRISRYLANKCTIASRIDCFSEVPTSVFGDKLREQVEERLAFYETGEPPRKNLEVMKEAMVEANEVVAEVKRKQEKKEKKKKKREKRRLEALAAAAEEMEDSVEAEVRAGAPGGCLSGRGCGGPAVQGGAGPCPAGFVGALGPQKKTAQPPQVREAACMDLAFVSSPGWTQPIYLPSVSLQENDTEPVKKKKKKKEQESLSEPEENGLEEDALPKKKRKLTGEAAQQEKKKKKAAKDLEED
ncbi:nucleolar protein 56 [Anas acuta]|uniref:nucleolar protein 56 n=1 Tax=Anas acuta TaxID=28680 RepID=UPI0035C8D904